GQHESVVEEPAPYIAWRRRVIHPPNPLYLEAHWCQAQGKTVLMPQGELWLDASPRERAAALQELHQGLRLLHGLETRGRRHGPTGFKDTQEFEDTLINLIRTAHAKGQSTKQAHVATLLRPVLDKRRGDIGSPTSVDVKIEATMRLIRKHLPCPWHDLVKKALRPL